MTHDPLCPMNPDHGRYDQPILNGCHCVVIARVREDERARILALSDRVKDSQYAAALRDAIAAASNQRSKFKARDWDDALDAAVAAITDLQP